MNRSAMRTLFVVFGMFVLMLENGSVQAHFIGGFRLSPYHFVIGFIGLALFFYGYYLWADLKGRHWAWLFVGLAGPIGVIPIAMLEDKSGHNPATLRSVHIQTEGRQTPTPFEHRSHPG